MSILVNGDNLMRRMMRLDDAVHRLLMVVRGIQITGLVTIPIAILFSFILVSGKPIAALTSDTLAIVEIVLASMSIALLILGLCWPKMARWHEKKTMADCKEILLVHILRISFFESIVAFGVILALMGGALYLILAMHSLSGIALATTYPTRRRLSTWMKDH